MGPVSKNLKILKFYFDQKNYFPVSLRPNYIDLHSFLTQNRKNNFRIITFLDIEFFPKIKKKCEQILWGSSPQNAHTDELKFDILLCLSPEVLWKNERTEKKLNCTMLSANSVPEGHCPIMSKCTNYVKTLKLREKLSWKRLIQGKLLTFGHACPLGGRCFCIIYPVGRGRGPARF